MLDEACVQVFNKLSVYLKLKRIARMKRNERAEAQESLLSGIRIKSGKRNWKYPEETPAHKGRKRKGCKRSSSFQLETQKTYPISVQTSYALPSLLRAVYPVSGVNFRPRPVSFPSVAGVSQEKAFPVNLTT
jgi:hypothetical protein